MHAQQQAYFLAQYEKLKPDVLGVIQEHQADLTMLVAKISHKISGSLIDSDGFAEAENPPTENEIVEIKRGLIGIYVAAFLAEQIPRAGDLESPIEQAFAGGRHDGRALRIGREAPRH